MAGERERERGRRGRRVGRAAGGGGRDWSGGRKRVRSD